MKPYDSEGWLHLLLLLLRTTRHTATHTRVSVAIFEPSPRPLVPAAFVPAAFEPASRSCPRRSCERSSPRPAWPRELSEAAMPPKGSKLSDVLNASHVAKHKAKPVVKPGRSLKTRTNSVGIDMHTWMKSMDVSWMDIPSMKFHSVDFVGIDMHT